MSKPKSQRLYRILHAFFTTPWAILPEKLEAIRCFLHIKAAGGDVNPIEIEAAMGARRDNSVQMVGRVAVVQCFGTICQRAGFLQEASGGISTEQLGATLDGLVADKQVRCICMVFDSPGGAVSGVPELADKIRGYRGSKKVYGMVDSMAASAAYWLASQCAELACTPSGMVGSIGVLAAHEDRSMADEQEGVKTTLIHAGRYKVEANPYEPLSDEAREELQSKVDHYYGLFVQGVADGRGTTAARVKSDMGQGRMLTADAAKKAGMVDRVCTLQDYLTRLGAYDGDNQGGARAEGELTPVTAIHYTDAEGRLRRLKLEMED